MDPSYNNSFGGQPIISSGGNSDIVMPVGLPHQQKSKKGLIIGIIIAFVVVIAAGLLLTFRSSTKNNINDEEKASINAKFSSLYNKYDVVIELYDTSVGLNSMQSITEKPYLLLLTDISTYDMILSYAQSAKDALDSLNEYANDHESVKKQYGAILSSLQENITSEMDGIIKNVNIISQLNSIFGNYRTEENDAIVTKIFSCNLDAGIQSDMINQIYSSVCPYGDMSVQFINDEVSIDGSSSIEIFQKISDIVTSQIEEIDFSHKDNNLEEINKILEETKQDEDTDATNNEKQEEE